jgi:hypothetical protein
MMAAPDMPSMRLAAEAYNVYFAYYHDAPAWDTLPQERKNVWVLIAAAGRGDIKHSGETKVSAEVKAASS